MTNTFLRWGLSSLLLFSALASANESISIAGIDDELKDNVLATLALAQEDCNTPFERVQAMSKRVDKQVGSALRPLGYYQAQISHQLTTTEDACWSLDIMVEAGEPVRVRDVTIRIESEAQNSSDFSQLVAKNPLQNNAVMRDDQYESFKSSIENVAAGKGYLDARWVSKRVDVYPKQLSADIELIFAPGKRYQIGDVVITDTNNILDDRFLTGLVGIKEGDYFSTESLFELRKALSATNYFKRVAVTLGDAQKELASVPLLVEVDANKSKRYSAGVGFSTDTGPRLSLGYDHRRFTRFGYQLGVAASISQETSEVSASVKVPSKSRPTSSWYNLDIGYRTENTDEIESSTLKLGLSRTRLLGSGWQNNYFIDTLYEEFDNGDDQQNALLFVPGTAWSLTRSDSPLTPKQGFKLDARLQGASRSLLSDADFLQLSFDAKSVITPAIGHRILSRINLGMTETDDFSQLPTSYRFYAGGDSSLRGYSYNALGERDADDNNIGGKYLFTSSVEYEYRFAGNWAVALFTDVGNAANDLDMDLRHSVGLGIRWFSPVGPVRFDIGVPLDDEANDKARVHISLGPDL